MNLKEIKFLNLPDETVGFDDVFKNKRVVVFGLPGAFTPTCSSKQLPGFDEYYNDIISYDIFFLPFLILILVEVLSRSKKKIT